VTAATAEPTAQQPSSIGKQSPLPPPAKKPVSQPPSADALLGDRDKHWEELWHSRAVELPWSPYASSYNSRAGGVFPQPSAHPPLFVGTLGPVCMCIANVCTLYTESKSILLPLTNPFLLFFLIIFYNVPLCMRMYSGVWICACMDVWVCGCVGVWFCGSFFVFVYLCVCVCVSVCLCVCVSVCLWSLFLSVCRNMFYRCSQKYVYAKYAREVAC